MVVLIATVFIGVGLNQINSILDRSLESTLRDRVLTILNSTNRLNEFILVLFITTISSLDILYTI